jgi:sugar transferase (PEP-CTERM system associated)
MSVLRLNNPRFIVSLFFEAALTFGVLYALALATLALAPALPHSSPAGHAATASAIFALCIYGARRARGTDDTSLRREVAVTAVMSLGVGGLAFLGVWAIAGSTQRLPAFLMLEGALVVPLTVASYRWVTVRFNILDGRRERILIVGTGTLARQVARWIAEEHSTDFVTIGFADEDANRAGEVVAAGVRIQTNYRTLADFCIKKADRLVVALDEKRGKLPLQQLVELRLQGVEIEDATTFFERTSGKLAVETMLPSWLIFSDGFKTSPSRLICKRCLDLLLSALLLLLTAPISALVAVLIKLDSSGPVLYRQKRVGRDGREFELLKFRSMVEDAESCSGPIWAQANDSRVTRIGKVIRKWRIDELPQLLNVLRGEMSFVGPRPERAHFVAQLEGVVPYYRLRLKARPGITGWAQVRYRYGATIEDAVEKLKYDLYYIKNASPLFDLVVVLHTIRVVVSGAGAR